MASAGFDFLPDSIDAVARGRMAAGALPLRAPAGTVLFRPGDPCRGFVLLRRGQARVDLIAEDGHALLLYRVEPGQACAITTSCLFAGEAYSAEGTAETDCDGLLLPAALFAALVEESPGFRRFVLAGFAARLGALMGRIEDLSFRSVDARLAAYLLGRAPGVVAATQQGIAADIGTAREVVSRRLAAFAKAGLVRTERGAVAVLDAPGLMRIKDGTAAP
ncbi:Crp/Fnr family transcriptional regulator [Roseomonas sp. HF4]|uniref:Crp/Fnr family transcriptional regulator n=1 Tax=Roseomonas sp. HF4 TaxID=2562313 RepID=UPI0010BFD193|nr:Crp/Fnr family transcriptional regulator [Roseomonas sp. HF4]